MALLCKKNELQFLTIAFFIILVLNGTAAATSVPSTLYVDAEGNGNYTTIQAAVNNSSSGDTILVYPGTYTENVNVSVANISILSYSGNPEDTIVKRLNVLSHNFKITANNVTISGFNITGAGSTGIYMSGFSGANITNNKLSGVGCGVQIESSSRCSLTNNTITDSAEKGFYLDTSSNCTIADNTISHTVEEGILLEDSINCTLTNNAVTNSDGIYLVDSDECVLRNNTASSGTYGIGLLDSENCTLTDNIMIGNNYNFDVYSSNFDNATGNIIDTSNLVDGKSVYYLEEDPDPSIGSDAGVVYCINCGDVEIKDLVLKNNIYAIFLYNTSSELQNNTINNTIYGVTVYSSQDVRLSNSTVENSMFGIELVESRNVTIESTNLTFNDDFIPEPIFGIAALGSEDCTFTDNNIQNFTLGIGVLGSQNCILTDNNVRNSMLGIATLVSENCTLTGNSIQESISRRVASGNSQLVRGEENTLLTENKFINENLVRSEGPEFSGIYSAYCENLKLENNIIDRIYSTGIYLADCQNPYLVNNSVQEIGYRGIYAVNSSDVELLDNTVQNVTGTSMLFDAGVRESTLTNSNLVQGISYDLTGICFIDSHGLRLENNTIDHINNKGVYLANCQNASLMSNFVRDIGGTGIYAVDSSSIELLDNVVQNVRGETRPTYTGNSPLVSRIQESGYGIYFEESRNIKLARNAVSDIEGYVGVGIYIVDSASMELLGNTVQNITYMQLPAAGNFSSVSSSLVSKGIESPGCGICSVYSENLMIKNNIINQIDNTGVLLSRCQNIGLISNSIQDVGYIGIYAADSSGVELLDNMVQNVTGKVRIYNAGNFPTVSSPIVGINRVSGYGIYFDSPEDIRLKGNAVKDSYQVWGIYLYEPVNATFESNTLENCQGGLVAVLGENFSISDCSVTNCTSGGILVINPEEGTGTGYTVTGCTVEGSDIGLLVTGEGTFSENTLSGNSYGLILYNVNNSLIRDNTLDQNSLAGLAFDLEDVEIMARSGLMKSMESPESTNNTIYNNYFNNVNNTLINSEANNTWNISKTSGESIVCGPYLGGNYWANPNGTGFSENCTDADKDGIADSSYEIVNGTSDYLPLTIIPTSTTTRHKSSANYIPSSGSSGVTGIDSSQKRVAAGSKTSFSFNNPVSGILGLSFTSQQYSGNVIVRIEVLDGSSGEKPEGEVYQLMNILVGNERFESGSNINGASINFRVSKSWVEENNIDVSTITINRFHNEKWSALVTEMTYEDKEYYYFTAETPGFSLYAITGDKLGNAVIVPSEDETGTVTGEEQTNGVKKSTPGFESTFAVLGILVSVFFAKKRILK
ncbi:NosD domain-containing protein [Methanosarcina sp.]|uniref:NosD domain-containing protein n=1 Tax=Methanosarcina sp. TaxID=2213 RepID=UPI002ABAAA43|nr:right-handed parallel beta-helix repeat-containing protein [Methanosarcina sp.]MDY9925445.1 NosD domain-containing protein [Methanosarcina sp.]